MRRREFHDRFGTPGPVVLPVIHVLDVRQTVANMDIAAGEGAAGVFLINHDFGLDGFIPIIEEVRQRRPDVWLGVNFLAVTGLFAFPKLAELAQKGCRIDAYWGDDGRIDERKSAQEEAQNIADRRQKSGWNGLYFGGVAFKKQRVVAENAYQKAANVAKSYMDVVTTSGVATGQAAGVDKIAAFRAGVGDGALALASGVTPENAREYVDVDAFLVATGINREGDFYTIAPERLRKLIAVCREIGRETTS